MHLGLIVGIGPAAINFYHRFLIDACRDSGANHELTMAHADAATLPRHQARGNAPAQVAIYQALAHRLQAAGARVIAITSIAGHFCIDAFKQVSPLPVIDLLVEVEGEIVRRQLRRVGLIGTRTVMETRFYGGLRGVEVVPPPAHELSAVHEAYVAMAVAGSITEQQRQVFFEAGRNLVKNLGAESVMLAGTDLALAFGPRDPGFPTLDCAAVHAAAIARAVIPRS